jgi:TIR domain
LNPDDLLMPDKFTYDVFLSHNAQDKPRVRRLAERLKAAGVRVWLDEWLVKPGDLVAMKVEEGLEQSRVLLLCISPAALASGWVALERSTAVHRDPAIAGRRSSRSCWPTVLSRRRSGAASMWTSARNPRRRLRKCWPPCAPRCCESC